MSVRSVVMLLFPFLLLVIYISLLCFLQYCSKILLYEVHKVVFKRSTFVPVNFLYCILIFYFINFFICITFKMFLSWIFRSLHFKLYSFQINEFQTIDFSAGTAASCEIWYNFIINQLKIFFLMSILISPWPYGSINIGQL